MSQQTKPTLLRAAPVAGAVAALALLAGGAWHWYAQRTTAHQDPEQLWALLDQYCVDCHNRVDRTADVAFDRMSPDAIGQEAHVFEAVVRKLRGRMMPPADRAPLPQEANDALVAWLEAELDAAAAHHVEPGHVVLHRLNRTEYANAVSELLALDLDPAELLPQDAVSDGFDNVANVLQVSPMFIDQYVSAAINLSAQAVGNPAPRPASAPYFVGGSNQLFHVDGLPLGTRGGAVVEHYFPADGEYELQIGDLAGATWVTNQEYENTLIATLDGVKFFETTLGGGEDLRAIDQLQATAVEQINSRLKNIRFHARAGPRKLAIAFLQRTFAESEAVLHPLTPGGGQDRVLRLRTFEIRGPFDPSGLSETPSRAQIFSCYPQQEREELACAEEILSRLARRAYRRPVADADMRELVSLYHRGRERGSFDAGIQYALSAILVNPKFLYRIQPLPEQGEPGSIQFLSDLELASRLSFFLWSSLPDDELLDLAEAGRLREPGALEQQVRRMLADPRSKSLVTNFAFQWLRMSSLDEINPDPDIFADVDPGIRGPMRKELELYIDSIFRHDRSVLDLLTADHTFLNERLALHYGITDVRGDRFRRVTLEDPARFGLLGKAAVLLVSSYPNRTTPVLRGAWILENITGTPPAPPPPGVEALPETVEGGPALTVRERLEEHRRNPSCNGCHGLMDPLGFALENFDATGRWREKDRFAGEVIDASAQLPDGTPLRGPVDLREALARRPDQFVQTFTEKLMTFALGRTVEHHDMPTVRHIVREAAPQDYSLSSIVLGIVESPPFQMRRLPDDEERALAAEAGAASH